MNTNVEQKNTNNKFEDVSISPMHISELNTYPIIKD